MKLLDGIVEWISTQIMGFFDFLTVSFLSALGCDMKLFMRVFPDAKTLYEVLSYISLGLILLIFVWQLFRNFFIGAGNEAEDPIKLLLRTVMCIFLTFNSSEIVQTILDIAGTPYEWILNTGLEPIPVEMSSFAATITVIIGILYNGPVAIITLVATIILGWNYLKLLLESAERYVLVGVMVFTAPLAFAMGASASTGNIFKAWCRMFVAQLFLLMLNAWCLKLFVSMIGNFIANPLGW